MPPSRPNSLLDRLLHRRALRRWEALAQMAETLGLDRLRELRARAREARRPLDRVIHLADRRLALPLIGGTTLPRLPGTDWAWRPPLWRGAIQVPGFAAVASAQQIAEATRLFHDCRRSELTIRQIRNTREADQAPFGVRMDVFRFDGTFLSLAIDLPPEAVNGLSQRHILRVDAIARTDRPLEIFARLNIRHGPNVTKIVRELPLSATDVAAEFDLAYCQMDEKRVEAAWLDLIFEGPEMNQITLRDVTLSRRPRADL